MLFVPGAAGCVILALVRDDARRAIDSRAAFGRMALVRRRPAQSALLAARSGDRRQLSTTLEVAWRFKTDSLGPRPEFKLEGTPLMVNGVLYTTAGTRRSVVALDAATGELLWVHARARRRARGRVAAPVVRTRRGVLDRRPGRTHPLRDDRLPARRARREDRRAHPVVRQRRHRRSEGRRRVRQAASRSIARPGRSGCTPRRRSPGTGS